MVNSASQALAEFKSQRLGGLLSGTSSTVSAPSIVGTSLSDTASDRMARSAPKSSKTAFLDDIRKSGQRYHQTAMGALQAKQAAITGVGGDRGMATGYRLPSGGRPQTGGPRGQYGLTLPAASSLNQLRTAYSQAGMGDLPINSGGRTYSQQAQLYALYRAGKGNKAAPPGTSLHESGIAVDFGGPVYNTNMNAAVATKQHAWLRQNAAQFGWYWVGKNYGESWHWEYHPEWAGR